MKKLILLTILIIKPQIINANTNYKPDYYTKEGYCVVNTINKRYEGLKAFKTEIEFLNYCKGKMIFKYKEDKCRWFTMKDMKFDILISDNKNKKELFKIGERKELCTNKVIEEIKINILKRNMNLNKKREMELTIGVEPITSSLPWNCSTIGAMQANKKK